MSWENGNAIAMDIAPSGSGTEEDPYLISQLDDLRWLSNNSKAQDKHFKQTADIDASEVITWYSGKGFLPIGNGNIKFTGTYKGQNFSIDGLYISRSDVNYTGLFGYASGAEITNISLTNVDIDVSDENSQWTGALGGRFDNTTLSNCNSSGTVDGNNSGTVGGLVGLCALSCDVSSSFSTCTVVGGNTVGGLVGQLYESDLSESYSTGTVSALKESSNGNDVGGLVGISNHESSISCCYSEVM